MSRPVHTLLWLTVRLCLCVCVCVCVRRLEGPEKWPHLGLRVTGHLWPNLTVTLSPRTPPTHAWRCAQYGAVKLCNLTHHPALLQRYYPPLRISSGLTTCCQLYFSQAMPSAAYSLLFPSIGTRAYSCARSSYETRPNPPSGAEILDWSNYSQSGLESHRIHSDWQPLNSILWQKCCKINKSSC